MCARKMTFDRFGRTFQLQIHDRHDLGHAVDLDEAHWMATGAPVNALAFDPVFRQYLDSDANGRILCFEIQDAISWLLDLLYDGEGIGKESDVLKLDAINAAAKDGQRVVDSCRSMLRELGHPDADAITLAQVRKMKSKAEIAAVSEAGVVLRSAGKDEAISEFIDDVVSTLGGAIHPAGGKGVTQSDLLAFLGQAAAYVAWHERGALAPGETTSAIEPLGAATASAYSAFTAVRSKLDEFFAQCEAVELDPRAAEHVRPRPVDLAATDLADPDSIHEMMKAGAIAKPNAEGILRIGPGINRYYTEPLRVFEENTMRPILGSQQDTLSRDVWNTIKRTLAAHAAWVTSKPTGSVERLGVEKLRRYAASDYGSAVTELIGERASTALVLEDIRCVEKLVLYQANMLSLANNFVSFPHLYHPSRRAVFEAGTLIMDGRHFTFSVRVDDRAAHSQLVADSHICVLYAELVMRGDGAKHEVAVPVTHGGIGNLCVGKRGVFIEVDGDQLDARVVQIVHNPISLGEAIWAPFQRLGQVLGGKIEKMTSVAEKNLDTRAAVALDEGAAAIAAPAPAPPAAPAGGVGAGGILLGGGVALAALSSALAYVTKTLASMEAERIVFGLLAAVLAVALPSTIVAWYKLRRRDLSALLEGAGWSINSRMRITYRQARLFTFAPRYGWLAHGTRAHLFGIVLIIVALVELVAVIVMMRVLQR